MPSETLFPDDGDAGKPLPHNRTATSKLAANLMRPFADEQAKRVCDFIAGQSQHGATDPEIQAALKMFGDSERPRRRRLVLQGRVKDSGNMRLSPSGRPATVWVAVSPDERTAEKSKTNWPTGGKTKPSSSSADDSAPDMIS